MTILELRDQLQALLNAGVTPATSVVFEGCGGVWTKLGAVRCRPEFQRVLIYRSAK